MRKSLELRDGCRCPDVLRHGCPTVDVAHCLR
jgi:hypothetical protein